jgi:hypothetical protein
MEGIFRWKIFSSRAFYVLVFLVCLAVAPSLAYATSFVVDTGGTLTTSLISYYQLEDTTDAFGSNNLTNNNSVAFVAGKVNIAGDFSASNSYLSLGSHISGATSNISMFAWVYLPSVNMTGGFFLNGNPAANGGNGDGYGLGVGSGSGNNTDSAGNKLIGAIGYVSWLDFGCSIGTGWHQVGLTYDGTTWKGWVDGSVCGTTYTGNTPNTPGANFVIGKAVNNLTHPYFTGKVDELGFWTKVLSSQEITDLYNSGAGDLLGSHPYMDPQR